MANPGICCHLSEKPRFVFLTHKIIQGCISLANCWASSGKCVNDVCHIAVTFATMQRCLKHKENLSGKNNMIDSYAWPGRCVHENSQMFLKNI